MSAEVIRVDYNNSQHVTDLINILNTYATGDSGGGEALSEHVRSNLANELGRFPGAVSFLHYQQGAPAALANCFMSFSTFACKPVLNIHDFVVMPAYRGLGLSQVLLAAIEAHAIENKCCKITLEVLNNNIPAKAAYSKFGFSAYRLSESFGVAEFWQKSL